MNTSDTIRNPSVATSRSPNGCSRQVMTQITPEEQLRLDDIAHHEGRSRSAMVRLLMLRGIEQYDADRAE
ncbi:hypothetical protein [Chromohalobacter israelensis]|uniref:hypothetical protein n=1 Tax=Chromohalobacter israelensis TaxID=141390 RepID=UPI001CC5ED68|nr:hypothetical protein [Chromohalobacter salexigens]MBZ5875991.1 hypothetical protein [Chromohalobacter salexigens]